MMQNTPNNPYTPDQAGGVANFGQNSNSNFPQDPQIHSTDLGNYGQQYRIPQTQNYPKSMSFPDNNDNGGTYVPTQLSHAPDSNYKSGSFKHPNRNFATQNDDSFQPKQNMINATVFKKVSN